MATVDEIEAYIKKKGACHTKEIAAWFNVEQPALRAYLGLLLSQGKLALPWTQRMVPWVWWRHSSTKYQQAGKLREQSRREHPEVWPERKKRVRGNGSETTLVKQQAGVVWEILSNRPSTVNELLALLDEDMMSRTQLNRALHLLEDQDDVYSVPSKTKPGAFGKPPNVWHIKKHAKDEDDWEAVVTFDPDDDAEDLEG